MPDAVVEIRGLEELQRFFKASGAIMGSAVGHGLVVGGDMVRTTAQENLKANGSYVTGKLSRSIRRGPVQGQGMGKWVAIGIAPGFGSPAVNNQGEKGGGWSGSNPLGRKNTADPQVYARYVEEGTRKHTIRPKTAKVLAFSVAVAGPLTPTKKGKPRSGVLSNTVFAREVNHPGTQPKPFLVPALQKDADRVLAAINAAIESVLLKARLNR